MQCKQCDEELLKDDSLFGHIGEVIECPKCKIRYSLEYEETWNGEEEANEFWLEEVF